MHIVESAHLRLFYTYQSQLLTKFQDKRSIWRCVPPGQENLPQERGMNLLTIEGDFPERTENQASGIFGLGRDSHVYKGNYVKHH